MRGKKSDAIRYCLCAKVKKQAVPIVAGPIFPIFGEAALTVSAKDEFLDYRNNRISSGFRQTDRTAIFARTYRRTPAAMAPSARTQCLVAFLTIRA